MRSNRAERGKERVADDRQEQQAAALPKSPLAAAIGYALRNWVALTRYTEDGRLTIDNTGWFGSNLTMPIINVPEVAILTMEAITKRPVVVETPDGDVIAIRPVMNMVLAIDHRANDGAQAAAFLGEVKAWLEAVGPETPID